MKGFFRKIVRGRHINNNQIMKHHAGKAAEISSRSRLALIELSKLTKDNPHLTERFNRIRKNTQLHSGTNIVMITGNLEIDKKACEIALRLHNIEHEMSITKRNAKKAYLKGKENGLLIRTTSRKYRSDALKKQFEKLILNAFRENSLNKTH